MIDSHSLERAEHALRVVYTGDRGRQMAALEVDRSAFDNLLGGCWVILTQRYPELRAEMDPRLEPAFNTLFGHMFLLGVVAGANNQREIV